MAQSPTRTFHGLTRDLFDSHSACLVGSPNQIRFEPHFSSVWGVCVWSSTSTCPETRLGITELQHIKSLATVSLPQTVATGICLVGGHEQSSLKSAKGSHGPQRGWVTPPQRSSSGVPDTRKWSGKWWWLLRTTWKERSHDPAGQD